MTQTVKSCSLPGCDRIIEQQSDSSPLRKYCSAEHSVAARRLRLQARANGQPVDAEETEQLPTAAEQSPDSGETTEFTDDPEDFEEYEDADPDDSGPARPTRHRLAGRRFRSRRTRIALGVLVAVVVFGLAAFGIQQATHSDPPSAAGITAAVPTAGPSTTISTASSTPPPSSTAPLPAAPAGRVSAFSATAKAIPTGPTGPRPASPPAPAAPPPVKVATIEDTQIGSGSGQVQYGGSSWTKCGGCNVATPNASYYYAYQIGDTFTVHFHGRQLLVYSPNDHAGGVSSVSVDGAPSGSVNYYTSGTVSNGLRWTSAVLTTGDHVVTFTLTGTADNDVELFDHADVYA
jgi:hypothetical protein